MNKLNDKLPLVSIIMPVYNGEKTLRYALASLLCQSYENWICIIVNDGSKDSTKEILDSLTDSRFRVYHFAKNSGRGIARDEALKHVEGKYLAYLDADDFLHRDKLNLQVKFMEEHPEVIMCSCDYITISEKFDVLRACFKGEMISENVFRYGQALPLLLPAIMVKLDHAGTFHYNHGLDVGEDYDFFARCCDGYKYGNIKGYLYYYMMNNTTAKKLLYYQFNSLNTCKVKWEKGLRWDAFVSCITRLMKICFYIVMLPLVGANRLTVNRYGRRLPSSHIIDEYNSELNLIKSVSL
ncbi:MAG: glycosyltransferase family 2 protein [Bacteroides sp.]|nr:glycosyltransferase family 2 protein [Bacteroides sp.]